MAEDMARYYDIIRVPHITEKALKNADFNRQYTFHVAAHANKIEVRRAVEKVFSVKVDKVCMLTVRGKTRRFRTAFVKKPDWKKAIVKLAEGHRIELM